MNQCDDTSFSCVSLYGRIPVLYHSKTTIVLYFHFILFYHRLLVNVGHDESYSSNPGTSNVVDLPQVDAVLVTDSSLQSLGGLPYYYGQDSYKSRTKNNNKPSANTTQIYATFPTVKMGQMNLYDHHANVSLDGGNPGYSLQDIDSLFTTSTYYQQPKDDQTNQTNAMNTTNASDGKDNTASTGGTGGGLGTSVGVGMENNNHKSPIASIQTLKYAQTVIINDPQNNSKPAISITPHKAGHLVGASYYILKRLVDETEVVVAPIYHHTKDKHLDSSTLYKYGTACDVLITCCGGPGGLLRELYSPLPKRYSGMNNATVIKRKLNPPSVGRDEGDLVETVLSTLRRGGNVILPVDASGRVLELVLLLNQHWEKHRLGSTYNLCWVGSMVQNTIAFAKSQLEWMAKPLGAQFDTGRGHPYSLKNMQLFASMNELESEFPALFGMNAEEMIDHDNMNSNSNPTCILASGATLDYGPARDLFLKWSENADNTIILTDSRRCVMRGQVVSDMKKKKKKLLKKGDGNISVGVNKSSGDIAVISDNESIASGTGTDKSSSTSANTTEAPPNIVQEDEEVAGTLNIGSAIASSELSEFSTAGQLLLKWCEAKAADVEMEDIVECDVLVPKRAALAGAELQSFLEREEEMRRKEKAEEERLAMLREVELAKGRLRLNENDDSAPSKEGDSADSSSKSKHSSTESKELSSSARPKKKSRFDANLFLKFSKPCHSKYKKGKPCSYYDYLHVSHSD
jgi:Cft2 family RNA processing exonuclease